MIRLYNLLLLLFPILLLAQVNEKGIPFITNYTTETYKAAEQNWSIIQDYRGVIYIGNNDDGVLEYDGVSWRSIPIKNNSIVRSLSLGNDGEIQVGAVSDFGALAVDENGSFFYKSNIGYIDTLNRNFGDVWDCTSSELNIFYGTERYVFKKNKNKIEAIDVPLGSFFLFNLKQGIHFGNYKEGLFKLTNSGYEIIKGGGFFKKKGVYTLNEFDNNILVGTFLDGLYWYSYSSGITTLAYPEKPISRFVKENQIYKSQLIDSNSIAIGTLYGGVATMNKKGDIINKLNKKGGLQDETVIDMMLDQNSNLWLTLNNGIAKVEVNNALNLFSESQGVSGYVTDVCVFCDRLMISTSSGVFYQEKNKDETAHFIRMDEIDHMPWSLLKVKNIKEPQLLVGTLGGLYTIDCNFNVKYIDKQITENGKKDKTNYIQNLYQSNKNPNVVYVALYNGTFSIKYGEKGWGFDKNYPVNGFDIRHVYEDGNGDVWFSSYINGVVRCETGDTNKMHFYNKSHGISDLTECYLNGIDGDIYLGTKHGFLKYSSQKQFFYSDSMFSEYKDAAYLFNQDRKGNVWVSSNNGDEKKINFLKKTKSNFIDESLAFKRLPNEQFDAIYHGEDGITWLGSSSGLYSYDSKVPQDFSQAYYTLVRKVTTVQDSIIFHGTNYAVNKQGDTLVVLEQPKDLIPILDYQFNDLTFEFAAPYFIEEKQTQYCYKLHGDRNEWSKWSLETKAVFTNLDEGKYTFKVKAKNIYDIESEVAEYQFTILPPWYRTILAYLAYAILGIALVIIIVKLYTRRLEKEKIRLEGIVYERTAEIRKQKEDIEKKNEILFQQKEEITQQKGEITSSIQYAKRIQKAIVPSEEQAECLLKDYFLLWKPRDIVSGDFWWLSERNNQIVVAAADCTGHGVPGAFMSMLGVSFLNEIVNQQDNTESHKILNHLRHKVKTTMGQTGKDGEAKDGMDIALMVIDFEKMSLQYSGAYNPLYLYRNGELMETKATKNPIGIYIKEKDFVQNIIELQKGDTLYIFSDGFPDQFGGPNQGKYGSKRFKLLLAKLQEKTMLEQKGFLNTRIENWMAESDQEQIDDIIILGIRI